MPAEVLYAVHLAPRRALDKSRVAGCMNRYSWLFARCGTIWASASTDGPLRRAPRLTLLADKSLNAPITHEQDHWTVNDSVAV